MIAFLRSFDINGASLALIYFCLSGACLFNMYLAVELNKLKSVCILGAESIAFLTFKLTI